MEFTERSGQGPAVEVACAGRRWGAYSEDASSLPVSPTRVPAPNLTAALLRWVVTTCAMQRLALEEMPSHPWLAGAPSPKPAAAKRTRRLSGLMRHALMKGVVPPVAPPTPPPESAKRRAAARDAARERRRSMSGDGGEAAGEEAVRWR